MVQLLLPRRQLSEEDDQGDLLLQVSQRILCDGAKFLTNPDVDLNNAQHATACHMSSTGEMAKFFANLRKTTLIRRLLCVVS